MTNTQPPTQEQIDQARQAPGSLYCPDVVPDIRREELRAALSFNIPTGGDDE